VALFRSTKRILGGSFTLNPQFAFGYGDHLNYLNGKSPSGCPQASKKDFTNGGSRQDHDYHTLRTTPGRNLPSKLCEAD